MKTHGYRANTILTTLVTATLIALGGGIPAAHAQITDLAQTPLVTTAPNAVKPNVMFILDDSGSMSFDRMPDEAIFAPDRYGRKAAHCNAIAYNPAISYPVPVDSTGAEYPAGVFPTPSALFSRNVTSAAPTIATGNITVALANFAVGPNYYDSLVTIYSRSDATRWMVGIITGVNNNNTLTIRVTSTSGTGVINDASLGDGDFRPFYYVYSGSTADLDFKAGAGSNFYRECDSVVGAAPGSSVFAKVVPAATDTNFKTWFTYHRSRMLTMRTAASRAFKGIDGDFRVGFSTINSRFVDGAKFLDVANFDATQKATWYSRLFGSDPASSTPLRGALSKAGMYFAKKGQNTNGTSQSYDPVQYSCQKNFSILTTDGYWNVSNEAPTFGSLKIDGTAVGQQDGSAARPMQDSATSTIQTRTSLLQERTTTTQWQSATMQLQSSAQALQQSSRSSGNWSSWSTVASCTPSSNVRCQYSGTWSNWSDVSSCTTQGTGATGGTYMTARQCRYIRSTWSNVPSCSPSSPGPSASSPYTVGSATVCQSLNSTSPWTTTSSCDVSASRECQYAAWSGWTTVASCTPFAQSVSPSFTVGTARECQAITSGGSSDSLADVAMYYYQTDLRTPGLGNCTGANGVDVCKNNVQVRGSDSASHQHMTTFTIGLGVSGTLDYTEDYLSGGSADYNAIVAGTKQWPNHDAANLNNTEPARIDDLWHAAVNGRGQYFSASKPDVLARSLTKALTAIQARSGTAAAAATTTLQPVAGENNAEYVTSYTTVEWVGDVEAFQVDPVSGVRSASRDWSAKARLDARVAAGTARKIYYMRRDSGVNTGTLRAFTYANLSDDGLGGHFSGFCGKSPQPAQCLPSGYDVAGANQGNNLVTWLRGEADSHYRVRTHVLADTVGGAPIYVGKPPLLYEEHDYQSFASNKAGRTGVVYVPSNGGMLHALRASDGEELWAFVPTQVMARMYRLADTDYGTKHQYYVNASPVVGDVWVPALNAWRTILVGGLGAGGRGYYALDVTDPSNPRALWEFSNDSLGGADNLGYTFGNPVITKRADGTWVVMFGSGYNNVAPGDGNGRLFVVDAISGQLLKQIATLNGNGAAVGTTTAPSGLANINVWTDSQRENKGLRAYGGDLLGNIWRFDFDALVKPHNAALKLATLSGGSPSMAQPVTTRPELATVSSGSATYPVVYVGTGKMLGVGDLTNTNQQSLYALKDPMTDTPLGDLRTRTDMVEQTLTVNPTTDARTVTSNPVDWTAKSGWRVDFPSSGERVSIDIRLALSTLVVGTNVPSSEVCTEGGGSAYLYRFDYEKGTATANANGEAGIFLGNSFVVGLGVMQLYTTAGRGTGETIACETMSDGTRQCHKTKDKQTIKLQGRRISWRELVN